MTKTINVKNETWQKLQRMRISLMLDSLDDVINRLIKLVTKFKLGEELKEVSK